MMPSSSGAFCSDGRLNDRKLKHGMEMMASEISGPGSGRAAAPTVMVEEFNAG